MDAKKAKVIKELEEVILVQRHKRELFLATNQMDNVRVAEMIIRIINVAINRLENGLDPITK